jgi:hypothetical protein
VVMTQVAGPEKVVLGGHGSYWNQNTVQFMINERFSGWGSCSGRGVCVSLVHGLHIPWSCDLQ